MPTGYGFAFAPDEDEKSAMRLGDLLGDIKTVLNGAFHQYYWIIAEVSDVSRSGAGHYYFDLIEPGPDGRPIASARGNLWARTAARVIPKFREITKQTFQKGMELMLQVKVEMNLQYGLSFTITDINPEYTLGNLERRREATIKKLQEDGVFDLNKQNPLPSLLLRIAVISSETAAGYGDFMTTIRQSGLESFFSIKLFQASMQGVNTTLTVNTAFAKIDYFREDFDAVFIMRGGGSKQDLAAFDDYDLCSTIANFPLPVLTAIGHEQDTSIADMVSHTRLKTPTALGEFLVGRLIEQINRILTLRDHLPKLLLEKQQSMTLRSSRLLSRTQSLLSGLEKQNAAKLQVLRQQAQKALTEKLFDSATRVKTLRNRSGLALSNSLERDRNRLTHLSERFPNVVLKHRLEARSKNTALGSRLSQILRALGEGNRRILTSHSSKLSNRLSGELATQKTVLPTLSRRLVQALSGTQRDNVRLLSELQRRANLLDPTRIMNRGFIVAVNAAGEPVTHTSQIKTGEELTLSLIDGKALTEIKQITQ